MYCAGQRCGLLAGDALLVQEDGQLLEVPGHQVRAEELQTGQSVTVLCCSDDISLLRDSAASVHGHSSSVEQLEGAGQLYEGPGPGHAPQHPAQLYYPSPNVSRPASQLTEEEQVSPSSRSVAALHYTHCVFRLRSPRGSA